MFSSFEENGNSNNKIQINYLFVFVCFGTLLQAIPAALGVSTIKQYHVNSLAVPRKAKEAIGGITKLTHADGKWVISNSIFSWINVFVGDH